MIRLPRWTQITYHVAHFLVTPAIAWIWLVHTVFRHHASLCFAEIRSEREMAKGRERIRAAAQKVQDALDKIEDHKE